VSLLANLAWDLAERKHSEEEVSHLNRMLRAVRKVNQLITVERDRDRLIQGMCDTFVETRGFDHAWIALVNDSGELEASAEAGEERMLSSLPEKSRQQDLPYCGREALARSEMVFVTATSTECTDCPLSVDPKDRTGIALPLAHQDRVYGVLSLSLPSSLATQEEQELVQEVGDDIGFALHKIELEEEQVQHDAEQDITLRILRQLHHHDSVPELVSSITSLLKEWSGFEAIGIRLQQGDDYPYYETRGFPEEHVRLESRLCKVDAQGETVRDFQGNPVLECMCGNVLHGRVDPELPFFSKNGSFWTNSTTDLLASTSEADRQARTRNRCQGEGYESVALIPLRHGEQTLGLLQLNDSRRNQFNERWVHLLERLADSLALAIIKRQAEDGLQEREHLFRQLFEQAPIGIFIASNDHRVIEVNQTAISMLGYAKEEILGMSAQDIVHPDDFKETTLQANLQRLLSGETVNVERRFCTKEGVCIHVMVLIAKMPFYNEDASHMVMFQDISERKRMEQRLREMSFFDSLTGLSNRNFFEAEMESISSERHVPLGIIICDLDGLKFVNDTLGHQSGDEMLINTASILQKNFRSSDIIARIGGDEFAILLPSTEPDEVKALAERLRRAMEEYNETGQCIQLSMSMGYAVSGAEDLDIHALFREADNRMYRMKLQKEQSGRNAIVQGLTRAIEARDFVTEGHCDRLQDLVVTLARYLDLGDDRINDLSLLSRFHDLGKVGVPDRILFKPGPLTDEEYEEMKGHCEIGFRIAQSVPDLHPIAEWILKHHERWDGGGYPQGLSGEDIPLPCRILAIADAYDAMTSNRPYRNAMAKREAVQELQRCAGTQFDPDLVDQFIKIVELHDTE
jgi:diguanylate cyclase (GGDEF)-like protein/PAS domain S-box-containing protein